MDRYYRHQASLKFVKVLLSALLYLPFCCNIFILLCLSSPDAFRLISLCGPEPIKGHSSLRTWHSGRVTSRLKGGQSNPPSVLGANNMNNTRCSQCLYVFVSVTSMPLSLSQRPSNTRPSANVRWRRAGLLESAPAPPNQASSQIQQQPRLGEAKPVNYRRPHLPSVAMKLHFGFIFFS